MGSVLVMRGLSFFPYLVAQPTQMRPKSSSSSGLPLARVMLGKGWQLQGKGQGTLTSHHSLYPQVEAERYPFTCIEKEYVCPCGCKGRHTLDAIMEVFVWCRRCLLVGSSHRAGMTLPAGCLLTTVAGLVGPCIASELPCKFEEVGLSSSSSSASRGGAAPPSAGGALPSGRPSFCF